MRSSPLRWALVVVPALAIALFDYVRHVAGPEILHRWPGSLLFMAMVAVGAAAITQLVFGLFERRRLGILLLARELTALSAISERSAGTDVLEAILERVLRSLPARAGAIYLLGPDGASLRRAASAGAAAALPERLAPRDELVGRVLSSGEALITSQRQLVDDQGCGLDGGTALAPLRSRDTALGVLALAGGGPASLRDDLDVIAALGSQVGVTVDNLRLFAETQALLEQSRHLAVLEERDRLAREMHDSLAQVLGLVVVKSRLIHELLARQETTRAAAEVSDLAETADAAYDDVREAILGLRGSANGPGLVGALQSYLQQFGRQSGLRARLVVQAGAVTEFGAAAEAQLIRVIQEALTNVRKHAEASSAVVTFDREAGEGAWARIAVEDNGRGFDVAGVVPAGGHGFGLQTMAERVQALGGQLRVDSQPGAGTRVIIRLPVEASDPAGPAAGLPRPAEGAAV